MDGLIRETKAGGAADGDLLAAIADARTLLDKLDKAAEQRRSVNDPDTATRLMVETILLFEEASARWGHVEGFAASRKRACDAAGKETRTSMLAEMAADGVHQHWMEFHTVSRRDGQRRVEVFDPNLLPPEYLTAPKPDTNAISKALHRGTSVPGARLVQGDAFLQIKARR